ncbi:MAG: PD-(D/E)XK nuclease family protein [Bacteroidales bacterium]|nr:PD-(D/E)XK nuclease family protein [Bacteroidales bacterium]
MTPFLRQVAAYYFRKENNIRECCFVFPNRRSLTFFRKYLGEEVAAGEARVPIIAPQMYTVNDFFYKVYDVDVTLRVRLLIELYQCYKDLYKNAESLDDFIFWGDVLLSDFDDVDKYLVDADRLFTNVADLKNIQDDYSYLTDTQRKAIEQFVSHFQGGVGDVKAKFLQIWNILLPLYKSFNARLEEKGMAYEGKVYRALAERATAEPIADIMAEAFPKTGKFVFVGLNALNACEKRVMDKMRNAHLAEFCWDYGEGMISDPLNASSFFMKENVVRFAPPEDFRLDVEGLAEPELTVVSVPSSVGQVKLLPSILEKVGARGEDTDTAIVLPDESLLMPLLNTVPPEVRDVNVTMGYPMGGSAFFALMRDVALLQLHARFKDGNCSFYHKQVWSIFANSVFRAALAGRSSIVAEDNMIVEKIKKEARYFVREEDFGSDGLLGMVFRPVVKDVKVAEEGQSLALESYLAEVAAEVGRRLRGREDMALELEFAREYYTTVNVLKGLPLAVTPATLVRVLERMLAGVAVPFDGEPLKGLQVMGPLEMRALDFRNLVIISANEGMFPRRNVSSSFIPPELRRGFELPTYEYQDAVWAYYFYRMIRRAEKVWMLYDSRTEGLRGGEESRYVKQLQYHFRRPVRRIAASADVKVFSVGDEIPKTQEDLDVIAGGHLSVSSVQSYLACQAQFYYKYVKKLEPEDEVAESLDAGMLGNVFHKTMQKLYDRPSVSKEYIEDTLKDTGRVKALIKNYIIEEMKSPEIVGRNLVIGDVIYQYVRKVLERDRELLAVYGVGAFNVLGLEKEYNWYLDGQRFYGKIDRMDSFVDDEVRIVDYKTGRVKDNEVNITDDNAETIVKSLFAPDVKSRPKIALQLFLYDKYAENDTAGKRVVNSIYSTSMLFKEEVRNIPYSRKFAGLVEDRLVHTINEIRDLSIPFRRTSNGEVCKYCDFKMICGR